MKPDVHTVADGKNKSIIAFPKRGRVNPFKMLKEKLAKAKDVKMLSDGRHSLFDKED